MKLTRMNAIRLLCVSIGACMFFAAVGAYQASAQTYSTTNANTNTGVSTSNANVNSSQNTSGTSANAGTYTSYVTQGTMANGGVPNFAQFPALAVGSRGPEVY